MRPFCLSLRSSWRVKNLKHLRWRSSRNDTLWTRDSRSTSAQRSRSCRGLIPISSWGKGTPLTISVPAPSGKSTLAFSLTVFTLHVCISCSLTHSLIHTCMRACTHREREREKLWEDCSVFLRIKSLTVYFLKELYSHVLEKGYFSQNRYQLLTFHSCHSSLRLENTQNNTKIRLVSVNFFWRIYICVCVEDMCFYVQMYTQCVWKPETDACIFFSHCARYFLWCGLSLNQGLIDFLGWLCSELQGSATTEHWAYTWFLFSFLFNEMAANPSTPVFS